MTERNVGAVPIFNVKSNVITDLGLIDLGFYLFMAKGAYRAVLRASRKMQTTEEVVQLELYGGIDNIGPWLHSLPPKIGRDLSNPKWGRIQDCIDQQFIPKFLEFSKRPHRIPVSSVAGQTVIFDKSGYRGVRPADPV